MTPLEPLLTLDEVAKIVKMSTSWLQNEIKAGRLKPTKLGKIVRVEPCDLRAFIDYWKRRNAPEIVTTLSITPDIEAAVANLTVVEKSET
jgi:predicted DNA-binding transcriptional regulator AlpA